MTRRNMFPSDVAAIVTGVVVDADPTRDVRMELNTLNVSWKQLSAYKRIVKHFEEQGGVFRYGMRTFDFQGVIYMGVEVDAEGWLMHELITKLDELNGKSTPSS